MSKPIIIFGADHAGFRMKQLLMETCAQAGFRVIDCGADSQKRSDYPAYAFAVAKQVVVSGGQSLGVLICGTGIGMSIAANKVRGARAALVTSVAMAKQSRQHDQANILVLASRVNSVAEARRFLNAFLAAQTDPDPGHRRRVTQITAFERTHLHA